MYTDLTRIIYPDEAAVGSVVYIQVLIKNQHSSTIGIKPTALVNGAIPVAFTPEWTNVLAGYTYSFAGQFIMPNADAEILAYSNWYGSDEQWHQEDYQTRTVSLVPAPDLKHLVIDRDPSVGGFVTCSPSPVSGTVYDGYHPKGTTVYVTAIPHAGYIFKNWSGELVDTTESTAPVYMSEDRTVTAHFEVEAAVMETLKVDIAPVGAGHVTTSPASQEGKATWHNNETGTFPYGTIVQVTGVPATGYVFDHWSDEIVGGVSYQNPSHVQPMTEHRGVKAHFRPEGEPDVETLEVDITPIGAGYVTTDPVSEEGTTEWHNGTVGTFPRGVSVQVTAHAYGGYEFEKWTDEIVGGTSYQNPAYVQTMVERRTVKCHFRAMEEPGLAIASLVLNGWAKLDEALGAFLVTVSPGDSLRVQVTVRYAAAQEFTKEFWVSFVIDPARDRTFKYNMSLPVAVSETDKVFDFDVPISAEDPLLKNKTYDLWVEFPSGLQDKATNAVTITGMPEKVGILDMVPMLITVMMMSMMMNMMKEV